MHENSKDDKILNISDEEILQLAFTDLKCAEEITAANKSNKTLEEKGYESFIPDLLTVVKANKQDCDGIGIAIRKVLSKQLNPVIQGETFKGQLDKSSLKEWLPEITSTNDLIDFVIDMKKGLKGYITTPVINKAIAKKLPKISEDLHEMRIKTASDSLEKLSSYSNKANKSFMNASRELKSATDKFKDQVSEEAKAIIEQNYPITTANIINIKNSLPKEESYDKYFIELEQKAQEKEKNKTIAEKYSLELASQYQALNTTPINSNTYTPAITAMLHLGIKTCKSSMKTKNQSKQDYQKQIDEKQPTYEIEKILSSGKIPQKIEERLKTAIQIIKKRHKELKEETAIEDKTTKDPTSTAEIIKIEQSIPQPETAIAATEEIPTIEEAEAAKTNQVEESLTEIEQDHQPSDRLPEEEQLPEATTKPELDIQNEKTFKEAKPEKSELEQLQEDLEIATGLIEKLDPKEGEKPPLNDGEKNILKLMSGRRDRLEKQIAAITEAKDNTSEHKAHSAVQELGKKYLTEDKSQEQQQTTSRIQKENKDNNEPQNLQHEIQTNAEIDSGVPEQENNLNEQAADTNTQEATKKQGILTRIFSAIKNFVSSFFKAESSEEEPPVTTPPDSPPIGIDSLETEGIAVLEDEINPLNQNNEGITDTEESEDEDGMRL